MKYIIFILLLSSHIFASIGHIMALKGTAIIERNNQKITATSGINIEEGDTVVTAKNTRTQIMLTDETVITIGSNSSFEFSKYFYDGTKKSNLSMKSSRGFFRSLTGHIGKLAPERFKIKTSSATIGIRGTDFSALQRNGIERFACYYGKIYVRFGNQTRNLKAGERFEFKRINTLPTQTAFTPKKYEVSDITELNPDKIPLNPQFF
jgi:hypothetical protein